MSVTLIMITDANMIPVVVITIMEDRRIEEAKMAAALIKAHLNRNRAASAAFSEVREVNDIMKQVSILRISIIWGRLAE